MLVMLCRCMTSLVSASNAKCPSCKTKLRIASTQRKTVQELPTFPTEDAPPNALVDVDDEETESEYEP